LTKAYGLGGLRAGVTLAGKEFVDDLYLDALNTVGTGSNLVELVAQELLTRGADTLEGYKRRWVRLKRETEDWLSRNGFEYSPNRFGVTYWVKMPMEDTYKWINDYTIPRYGLAAVPGSFFLFGDDYRLTMSNRIRLGIGNISPDESGLEEGLGVLYESIRSYNALG